MLVSGRKYALERPASAQTLGFTLPHGDLTIVLVLFPAHSRIPKRIFSDLGQERGPKSSKPLAVTSRRQPFSREEPSRTATTRRFMLCLSYVVVAFPAIRWMFLVTGRAATATSPPVKHKKRHLDRIKTYAMWDAYSAYVCESQEADSA